MVLRIFPNDISGLKSGLFFVHFQKTQGPKNSTSKKTQGHFLPKNSICRDFLRLHIKKLNANDFNKCTLLKADGIN